MSDTRSLTTPCGRARAIAGRVHSGTRRQHRALLLAVLLAAGSIGCWVRMYRPEYRLRMHSVDVSSASEADAERSRRDGTAATDDWLRVEWIVTAERVDTHVTNLGSSDLVLRWEQATFVGAGGASVRPTAAPALRLAPGEEAHTSIRFPSDDRLVPTMPGVASENSNDAERFARDQIGKTITIVLPVERDGELRRYRVVFTVEGYDIESFAGA